MNISKLLLLVFAICLLSQCSSFTNKPAVLETANGSYQLFEAEHRSQQLYIPQGWKPKEHYKSGTVYAAMPFDDKQPNAYRASIHATPRKSGVKYNPKTEKMEPEPIDLEQFTTAHLTNLEKTLPDFKLLKQDKVTINGKDMNRFSYQYQQEGDAKMNHLLQCILYLTLHQNEIYLITFTDAADHFEQSAGMFQDVIDNWDFEE